MLQQFDILLVDDSATDAMVFTNALHEVYPSANAYWVSSGEDAIAFLRQEGEFCDMGRVKLVVLDLNMPGLNGIETLRLIKSIPAVNLLPVVLLSGSRARRDIDLAYSLGASVFFRKLTVLEDYLEEVRVLVQHWLRFAELPSICTSKSRMLPE